MNSSIGRLSRSFIEEFGQTQLLFHKDLSYHFNPLGGINEAELAPILALKDFLPQIIEDIKEQ